MKIQMMSLGKIKPYENNPRRNEHAVHTVARSLKEFGFRQPIVVDKEMTIVAGHTRYLAAKYLKLQAVPVHVADTLTPKQVAAYRLADNKVSELADWDDEMLQKELVKLSDFHIDMASFGFDMAKLAEVAKADQRWLDDYEVKVKPKPAWILMALPEADGPALLKRLRKEFPTSKIQGSFEDFSSADEKP